jgi:hypothetical protein
MADRLYSQRTRKIDHFVGEITSTLQGQTPELQEYADTGRLDFHGMGALVDIFDGTAGKDRVDIIRAIERIVRTAEYRPPLLVAQVIDFAASPLKDISEIEPEVRRLSRVPLAQDEPIKSAIIGFQLSRKRGRREL